MNIGRKVNYNGIMKVDTLSPKQAKCPICHRLIESTLGEHIKQEHGEEQFRQAVLKEKEKGTPDPEIGLLFGITFKQLEDIITQTYGINISVLKKPKKVKRWAPKDFKEETTTVWSFKQRGNWATHDGRYRGNWSPYIPRNVILKYSKPGDVVLDYFVGGGTTAVEAKLLGRKCIARDINPAAIGLTLENLKFDIPQSFNEESHFHHEPEVSVGDARDLSDIPDESINLICAHPPYAGIISYSSKVEGDLSKLSVEQFLVEMGKVAKESLRVLKPGGKCAILIGDTRKKKHVVPIGFQTINVFLNAGFKLKELVIKRQHNCKTTGFWYERSIKYNFLLLAHEYLPIFEKPKSCALTVGEKISSYGRVGTTLEKPILKNISELETTTVWIFPEKDFEEQLNKNVINRYSNGDGYLTLTFTAHSENKISFGEGSRKKKVGLFFLKSPFLSNNPSKADIKCYLKKIREIVKRKLFKIKKGGFLVIQTQDVRIDGLIEPLGKRIVDLITSDNLWLKEIVVITRENQKFEERIAEDENLKITHQYLLIYEVIK
jgi:SAM-dependent methyltransferase